MAEKTVPTEDELTQRTRVMRVEIDRAALAKRAKKDDADDDADDEEVDDPPDDEVDEDDRDDDDDDDDERAAKLARRRSKYAATRKAQRVATRAAAAAEDLLPIAISSEYPVERYDWWEDERYEEVLAHTKDAVDLSRATDGLPFLDSHNAYSGDARMGRVLNVRLAKDGKLRGDVKFSRRQVAQDLRQDFLDGIACEISVGYRIDPNNITRSREPDGPVVKRINRWMPYEVSSVSVPADPTVGAGRSAGDAARRSPSILVASANGHRSSPMKEADKAAADAAGLSGVVRTTNSTGGESVAGFNDSAESKAEKKRIDDILTIVAGQDYGVDAFAKAREFLDSGKSAGDVAQIVLAERKAAGATKVPTERPSVELTPKEQRQYSLQTAIRGMIAEQEGARRSSSAPESFEREISQQLEKSFPVGPGIERRGGMLVPTWTRRETILEIQHGLPFGSLGNVGSRAGLDSGTATKGQELKFTVPGEFLALLRNFMALTNAGATMLGGLQGPVAFPNQTAPGTATWVGENPGSDVSDTNLLLSQIALNPRSLQSTTSYSRQLLAQSVIDVDGMVRQDLAAIMALALDLAGIAGTGASNQPTGILSTAGIGSVAGGTNGLTPLYTHLVDLETQVTAANADQWPLSYLVHPTSRGTFKKAPILANTIGIPSWQKGDNGALGGNAIQGANARIPGELNGYPAWASAQVPNNLTKGTASGICLALIFGAFSQCVIGDWGMMEIIVDPYRLKKQGMIELTSFGMFGVAVKYPAAFAAMKDALA
jgi:HK97 family phage major capsid protein